MPTEQERETAHKVLTRLFDLPVRDMGGGLCIVEPYRRGWMPVEERDLIVKAISEFIRR